MNRYRIRLLETGEDSRPLFDPALSTCRKSHCVYEDNGHLLFSIRLRFRILGGEREFYLLSRVAVVNPSQNGNN